MSAASRCGVRASGVILFMPRKEHKRNIQSIALEASSCLQ